MSLSTAFFAKTGTYCASPSLFEPSYDGAHWGALRCLPIASSSQGSTIQNYASTVLLSKVRCSSARFA